MSQQTKYTLKFPKGLKIGIQIWKSTEAQTGFKSTYKGRQIRMIKVLAKDDIKPKSIDDLEEIVPWTGTTAAFPYQDEDTGEERLLYLDERTKCRLFQKSEFMNGIGFIDRSEITPNMYKGDHYFIKVQVDTKSKKAAPSDIQGYTLLYHILNNNNKMFLTKFVSGDREKFSVIYAVNDGLMLSTIIHANYQREAPAVSRIPLPKIQEHAQKMLNAFDLRGFDTSITVDKYEENIRKYIDELRDQEKGIKPKIRVKMKSPVNYEEDFLSQLDSL